MFFPNFLTILSLIITSGQSNDDHSNVLIKILADVQNYYKSSTTIVVNYNLNWKSNNILLKFAKNHDTFFSAIEFSQFMDSYRGFLSNPIHVIFLNDVMSINKFQNISRNIQMSRSFWLVIFENEYLLERVRSEGNVFNLDLQTEMLVTCFKNVDERMEIEEWYALRSGRTITRTFAVWNNHERLKLIGKNEWGTSLYRRRSDLFGERLRIVFVENSTFVDIKNGTLEGLFGNIINELERVLNFTSNISGVPTFGNWDQTENRWTGCLGQVVDGNVDIGVAEFAVTRERKNVVDFSLPIVNSKSLIHVSQYTNGVHWAAYFQAFDRGIWLSLIIIILTTPILLTLIKSRGSIRPTALIENYIKIWGIYCQQGLSEFPKRDSMRFAYFSIFLSALIISSSYSAFLISYLTIVTTNLPFKTMREFSNDNSYKLIVVKNSSDYDLFANSDDEILKRAMLKMKNISQLPSTISEAIEQICSEKYLAFVLNEISFRAAMIEPKCKIISIDYGRSDDLAMIFSKNNPYGRLINYHLQRFVDNGMMKRWKREFFIGGRKTSTRNSFEGGTVHVPVRVLGIAPLLAVVTCGIVLSLFIVCLERLWFSRKREIIDKGKINVDNVRRTNNVTIISTAGFTHRPTRLRPRAAIFEYFSCFKF